MKILIIGFAKIKYMPYLNLYLDNINIEKNDIHLLYWNRDLKDEDVSSLEALTLHEFKFYQEDEVKKFLKIKSFIKYRKYAIDLIKQENFDFIIFFHTLPGLLVADQLKKKYKNKFIFDYRDSTYEAIPIFKKSVCELVKYSKVTFVSSDAFRKVLPQEEQEKIYTTHNILSDSINHRDEKKHISSSGKIRMAFWGFIRHKDVNIKIIDKISKDDRFELHYYGREQETAKEMKAFVFDNGIKNVFFHGEYKPEDRYEFAKNTDIIHNIYDAPNTLLAMGNKYYDGIIFRIPQIFMPGSFMGKVAEEAGVGKTLSVDDELFTDKICEYFFSIDRELFEKNCDKELKRVMAEYDFGRKVIQDIFK